MTPTEFLEIINALPLDQRKEYANDLLYYGRGYVRMNADGIYERIAPEDIHEQRTAGSEK